MSQRDKLLLKILRGTSDADILFDQLCQLLKRLGFEQRIGGSHHIFYMDGIEEILNLQPKQGKGKAYQVKQVRNSQVDETIMRQSQEHQRAWQARR
jgi:hypothetical protein